MIPMSSNSSSTTTSASNSDNILIRSHSKSEESVSLIIQEEDSANTGSGLQSAQQSVSYRTAQRTYSSFSSSYRASCCFRNWKWIMGAMAFILIVLIGQRGFIYVLRLFFEWVRSIGFWGNVMFILMFFVVSFPFVLGGYIPLTMGAGSLYGVLIGTITVSIGSTIGGIIAYWVCKKITEKWVDTSSWKESSQFKLFTTMLHMNENSLVVTLLARLAPIPFGLQNIFFVLAEVPFRNFVLVTWFGLLPLQILYTYFGATLRNLSDIASGQVELDHMQRISLILQVVVIVGLVGYFAYLMRKMKRMQEEKDRVQRDVELQRLTGSNKMLTFSHIEEV